jgi:phage N-6-adenine-methyltransferase
MNREVYSRTKWTSDDWETPPYFFKKLDDVFHFTLDACATAENTKCIRFFTKEQDGLKQDWEGETVFVNPPFSHIKKWAKKCYEEGMKSNTVVVMLCPSRTDTRYWHDYIMNADEIWFCKGRVNFLKNGKKPKHGSTFPLAIVVFDRERYVFCTPIKIKSFEHK